MELEVPANLYGMAIAEPPQLSVQHDGKLMCALELWRVFAMLIINYLVCVLFVLHIAHMNLAEDMQCSVKFVVLEFVCLFTFEVRMLADLEESLSMMSLLWFAPGPITKSSSGLSSYVPVTSPTASPRSGAVLAAEKPERKGWFTRKIKKIPLGSSTEQASTPDWKLEGLTQGFRIFAVCAVAFPKLALGLAVAIVGGEYIVKSPDEETMVMSTLAVVFIADIDDILYTAFTSSVLRFHLENMVPVNVELSNNKRLVIWASSSVFAPMFCMALTVFIMYHTRSSDCGENGAWTGEDLKHALWHTFHMSTEDSDSHHHHHTKE